MLLRPPAEKFIFLWGGTNRRFFQNTQHFFLIGAHLDNNFYMIFNDFLIFIEEEEKFYFGQPQLENFF